MIIRILAVSITLLCASVGLSAQPSSATKMGAPARSARPEKSQRSTPVGATPTIQPTSTAAARVSPSPTPKSPMDEQKQMFEVIGGIAVIIGVLVGLAVFLRKHSRESRERQEKLDLMSEKERSDFLAKERQAAKQNVLTNHGKRIQQMQNTLVEYRRTCRSCGTVWHSLPTRENQIESDIGTEAMTQMSGILQGCSTCGMCGTSTAAQASHNVSANQTELQRLRSCPKCTSVNYTEQVIQHANTPAK